MVSASDVSGTKIAAVQSPSAWLQSGRLIEVGEVEVARVCTWPGHKHSPGRCVSNASRELEEPCTHIKPHMPATRSHAPKRTPMPQKYDCRRKSIDVARIATRETTVKGGTTCCVHRSLNSLHAKIYAPRTLHTIGNMAFEQRMKRRAKCNS